MSSILDLDALLDSTMDNVPDVPDYLNPPDGNYVLSVPEAKLDTYENAKKEKVNVIVITYEIKSTIETKSVPVPDGSLFTERFQATEDGLKYFKKRAIGILNVSDLNGVPIREVLASLKGVEFEAQTKIRKSVGTNGQEYENINVRPLTAAADTEAEMDKGAA